MVNETTPEERLKRYKKQLEVMAEAEHKVLKFTNPVKKDEHEVAQIPSASNNNSKNEHIPKNPSPPRTLVSPSKRELRESMIVTHKSKSESLVTRLPDKDSKNRIMLKARMKAIDSKLQDIKSRKAMIELQYKRKLITKSEYEKRIQVLIAEGKELLREKARIDTSLSR